jgi:hypothetical protein
MCVRYYIVTYTTTGQREGWFAKRISYTHDYGKNTSPLLFDTRKQAEEHLRGKSFWRSTMSKSMYRVEQYIEKNLYKIWK